MKKVLPVAVLAALAGINGAQAYGEQSGAYTLSVTGAEIGYYAGRYPDANMPSTAVGSYIGAGSGDLRPKVTSAATVDPLSFNLYPDAKETDTVIP